MTARTNQQQQTTPIADQARTTPQHPSTPLRIPFTKMHGLANDYIFINTITNPNITQKLNLKQLAINISNRRTGVGSDGLILLEPHPLPLTNPTTDQTSHAHTATTTHFHPAQAVDADVRMRMFNADGSIGEMCGNGARCLALLAAQTIKQRSPTANPQRIRIHAGHLNPRTIIAEILTKTRPPPQVTPPTTPTDHTNQETTPLAVEIAEQQPAMIRIDMGIPTFEPHPMQVTSEGHLRRGSCSLQNDPTSNPQPTPTTDHKTGNNTNPCAHEHQLTLVSMGNPHAVVFVESENEAETLVRTLGPQLQNHPSFQGGVNFHAAVILNNHHIAMRTWERGSGYTHACGSGACAVFAAAIHNKQLQQSHHPNHPTDPHAKVTLPGGDLHIAQSTRTGSITMTGPAETTCEGVWTARPNEQLAEPTT